MKSTQDQIEKLIANQNVSFSMEKRYIRKDQTITWIKLNVSIVRNYNKEPSFLIGFIDEINQKKQDEYALTSLLTQIKDQEQKYRELFDNAQVGIFRSKMDGSAFIEVNKKFCDILGYSKNEIFTLPVTIIWADPNKREDFISNLKENGHVSDYEAELLDKNKNLISVLFSSKLNREKAFLEGSIVDISERKKVQIENEKILKEKFLLLNDIKNNEEKLRLITDSLPVLISYFDDKFRYQFNNKKYDEWFEYPHNQIKGKYIWEIIGIEAFNERKEFFQKVFSNHITHFIGKVNYRNKEVRDVETTYIPHIGEDGQIKGVFVIGTDVTERIEMENKLRLSAEILAKSNKELEQFAYIASHDLQEPLRMISSYLRLIQKRYQGKLDNDADDFIHFAMDGAIRMHNLIDGLLSYSRIGTKGKEFNNTDMNFVLKIVRENLKILIAENQAEIQYEMLPEVFADSDQIIIVFQNLIENAIKFRCEINPKITISFEKQEFDWKFAVKDNGIGIDPDDKENIFQIFRRLHTQTEHSGSGIGLANCKKIIERHGGKIWVESQLGQGATFFFTIPQKIR